MTHDLPLLPSAVLGMRCASQPTVCTAWMLHAGQAELQSSRASRDTRKSLKTQNKAMLKGSKIPSALGRAKGVSKQLDPEEWETNLTY